MDRLSERQSSNRRVPYESRDSGRSSQRDRDRELVARLPRDEEDRDRRRSERPPYSARREDSERYRDRHHASSSRDLTEPGSRYHRRDDIDRDRRHKGRSRSPDARRHRGQETGSKRGNPRPESSDRAPGLPRPAARERSSPSQLLDAPETEEAPDFAPSGLLAKESNQVNGTALKYHEPPEAKKPKKKWRLYVFKDGSEIDLLHVSRQSCYLFGRDRAVVDVPLDHSSCSKQHAVLQYRLIVDRNEFGDERRIIKPFILDLESANGTTVNGKEVPASRYYELRNGDTVRFAASERDWVLLCEDS